MVTIFNIWKSLMDRASPIDSKAAEKVSKDMVNIWI